MEALAFGGICGFSELIGHCEEALLLCVFELETCFEQIDENAVDASPARFGHCAYAFGDSGGDGDA